MGKDQGYTPPPPPTIQPAEYAVLVLAAVAGAAIGCVCGIAALLRTVPRPEPREPRHALVSIAERK